MEAFVVDSSGYRRISQGMFWFRTFSLHGEGLANGMLPLPLCLSQWVVIPFTRSTYSGSSRTRTFQTKSIKGK